jgi:hypothetical protein
MDVSQGGARAGDQPHPAQEVRLGSQRWGPLPGAGTEAPSLHLNIDDAAGVISHRSLRITIHELRCLPSPGGLFPWSAIPSLVAASADWIERKSAELPGHTLLLGTIMPPETALGLGIIAGQTRSTGWPENLWPLIYRRDKDSLVIPDLNLGRAALRDPDGG